MPALSKHLTTQEVLAQRLGKSQSTIANKMRLLRLPREVQDTLVKGQLSERHARALLRLGSTEQQKQMVQEIIQKDLTVSETEKKVDRLVETKKREKPGLQRKVCQDTRIF